MARPQMIRACILFHFVSCGCHMPPALDRRCFDRARSNVMFYRSSLAHTCTRLSHPQMKLFIALCLMLLLCTIADIGLAQSLEREINTPEKVEITIKNPNGRVNVVASDDQQKKISIKAESLGAPLTGDDVRAGVSGERVEINVRSRGSNDRDRIDLSVRVPARARVKVQTDAGAVDVSGPLASAEVATNTGTIRADVPLDFLKFNFVWNASRPRYFSEVALPEVKEKRGGRFEIAGRFGSKKVKDEDLVELDLVTERGVVLFGVDPSMVPGDLRERPLTEAARAIIRSGNEDLIEAIHKVTPRRVGDFKQTLPPPKGDAPTFVASRLNPGDLTTQVAPRFVRLNASVTDRHGRAISGLTEKDFSVTENGEQRPVSEVAPALAPFNLVLLLDVSGSVEERLDFIRKAALSFINTVSPQDRIAIISFRDDVQLISDFTTDRSLLTERVKDIEAGGGTALYDALAYTLVHTLRPLRGERTAVVILSDGDDNKSFIPFPTLLEATIESGALIYPLYIPSGLIPSSSAPAPVTTLDPTRTRFLTLTSRADEEGRKLASFSGGVYYPITRLDELQRAYDDVVAQLRTSYTITYVSDIEAQRERRVRVRVGREGASVRLSPAVGVTSP